MARAKSKAVTWKNVVKIALALPGVEEGISYGTPALRVRGKFLARLREDGALVVRIDQNERDFLMQSAPKTFYITDHYRNYDSVLVRLSTVRADDLRQLLERAWRAHAPKRLIAAYEKAERQ